ncbi:Aste57867_11101 [Aphanomyces stellatus]|uniref:Aste57867_11101 protein n=1 Tax=Aphanomyces stellatus TaxID=120398 RepID=A0A485KSM4_9STRA|nr:hypothetical protein As57867_011059 [Aphanomyces stellatus]VFT87968.1 Aste57867_11101 [Aphanomyces stellatus]
MVAAAPVPSPVPDVVSTPMETEYTKDYVKEDGNLIEADQEEITGCSIPFMFLLCAPKMAMNMSWAAQWAALGPLLQVLLSPSAVQAVQLVGPTTGLLIAPTVGVLCDANTHSWGRRRPFLFWGAITSAICWAIMMNSTAIGESLGDKGDDRTWTTVFVVICYVWMDITVNITQVPASLIIADFAGNRQVTAASIGGGYSIAGSFVVSGFIMFFGPAHQHIQAFLGMLIAIMLITTMTVCYFVKEIPYKPAVKPPTGQMLKDAFVAVWVGIRKLPKTLAVYCIVFLLVQYGYTAYNGEKGQFFGLTVKGGIADDADKCGKSGRPECSERQTLYNDGVQLAGGLTDTIFNLFGLCYLACMPFLVRKLGVKTVITASIIPQALLIIMAYCKVIAIDMIIVIACSITQQMIFSLQIPMIIHHIGHGYDNNLGLFSGAMNSANCMGQFLNFIFASVLVRSSMGHALPILVGGILSAIGFFVSFFFLKVDMHSM